MATAKEIADLAKSSQGQPGSKDLIADPEGILRTVHTTKTACEAPKKSEQQTAEKFQPISFIYPVETSCIICTDSRKEAIQSIQNGYQLFVVPQMFKKEEGVIVLYQDKPDRNRASSRMTAEDAARVLSDYEQTSRRMYNSE